MYANSRGDDCGALAFTHPRMYHIIALTFSVFSSSNAPQEPVTFRSPLFERVGHNGGVGGDAELRECQTFMEVRDRKC